jgi:hypothetical protein
MEGGLKEPAKFWLGISPGGFSRNSASEFASFRRVPRKRAQVPVWEILPKARLGLGKDYGFFQRTEKDEPKIFKITAYSVDQGGGETNRL